MPGPNWAPKPQFKKEKKAKAPKIKAKAKSPPLDEVQALKATIARLRAAQETANSAPLSAYRSTVTRYLDAARKARYGEK